MGKGGRGGKKEEGEAEAEKGRQASRGSSDSRDDILWRILDDARREEQEFPSGFCMKNCESLSDKDLMRLCIDHRVEDSRVDTLKDIRQRYESPSVNLKAAVLKCHGRGVGYMTFTQDVVAHGSHSGRPLDSLLWMYLSPRHRSQGHATRMVRWWLREHVRSVKYFNVANANVGMGLVLG
ncbi:unnamed protein product, partial [Ostreobium quekettii]